MNRTLCTEDLVFRKNGDAQDVATVDRTNTDVDTHVPHPERHEVEPILTNDSVPAAALKKFKIDGVPPQGTVYVRWVYKDRAELIAESELELLHRSLFIGDIVTRRAEDVMSGVVLNVHTNCSLRPMGRAVVNANNGTLLSLLPFSDSGDELVRVEDRPPPLQDIPASELMYEESPSEDDLVIFKGWVGRVLTMTTALTIRLTDNSVVEVADDLCELLSDHPDVPRVGDIVKTKKGNLRTGLWKFGQYNPNTPPIGSVVSTRATTIEVAWLQARLVGARASPEPPRVLERAELESESFHVYDRSRRPSTSSPELTVSNSEIETSISLRVRFRDLAAAEAKYTGSTHHGKVARIPRQETLGYDMNVYEIASVAATVTVQWQDLTVTRERAVDLLPDAAIDDAHAAWPGEIAHSLAMEHSAGLHKPGNVGVIQCVKPDERMAAVRWCSGAQIAYSKAEPDDKDPEAVAAAGGRELVQNLVGVADGETEELSLYDVECPGELNVRRGDIVLITSPEAYYRMTADDGTELWLGEVVDTWLDGRLLVRCGAEKQVRDVALRREEVFVAIRSDGTDGLEGLAGQAEGMEEDGEFSGSEEDDEWESETEDEEVLATYENENGEAMDVDEVENGDWESADEDEMDEDLAEEPKDEAQAAPTGPPAPTEPTGDSSEAPAQYAILDTPVPADHHYASEPSTTAPTHLKRTQKEHKILSSPGSLPSGVYIRTWESRLDLFRALFIGPADTPYASAPFVIDIHLPTDYPHAPPRAFFHSWPGASALGGVGRVNPNLYEDGKICLSLLGTWEGDRGEGWSAAKSTLLQLVVSLLGLVLVPEPYFNEAGYEPLAGLESSKRPSALYNERTFLRASGFLIDAVEAVGSGGVLSGLEGLREEVRWLYTSHEGPGLLREALGRVEGILGRSEGEERVEPDGATAMSKGACIPLRRVRDRLRGLVDGLDE